MIISLDDIISVLLKKATKEHLLQSKGLTVNGIPAIVQEYLELAIKEKNAAFVEAGFLIAFTYDDAFPENIESLLCSLITEDWHHKHEDIAMLLKDLKQPSSVNALYNAAEIQFSYLSYDDTFQFSRKCIKALSEIGDSNAIEKLRLLLESSNSTIAEYAKKELRYKNLL